jgi:hypoxanthine-guanine phosphoribosyltransferase
MSLDILFSEAEIGARVESMGYEIAEALPERLLAVPIMTGNTICENETNVSLVMGAEMPETAGNEVCADDI